MNKAKVVKRPFVTAAFTGLMLFSACASGNLFSLSSGPGDAVKGMYMALLQGDLEGMKRYLPKEQAKMSAGADKGLLGELGKSFANYMFEGMAREIKAKGGIKSFDIDKEQINGDSADVAFTIRFGNGEARSGQAKCRKEDGVWKVVS